MPAPLKLMVATDFSERSDRALRRATLIAREVEAELSLIHVVDEDQPRRIVEAERNNALAILHEQVSTLREMDGVSCTSRVVIGTVFGGIVQATREESPAVLIIGPHRRQELRDLFMGTTAERTIREVSCPVLMTNGPPVAPYRKCVLTTDCSDGSRRALGAADSLGIAPGAISSLMYVFDAPVLRLAMSYTLSEHEKTDYLDDERREAMRHLVEFAAKLSIKQPTLIVRQDKSTPASEILAAAEEQSSDLIVVGTRGASGFTRLLLGSVAEEVLRRARCDVLAVPPGSLG
ncbi:universal stress protein [Candidatus Macondimonas diazotrophica]|jgi:nucleotide-binding universal stress UspA family protein|nr:universal stress protein [Candidatus Macondimonas diazotrophica]HBG51207.1 universal stress protein [Gammaproteobacteria bacterium]HCO42736.1 universal stress protein [Gammaproteobacteria bacterium]